MTGLLSLPRGSMPIRPAIPESPIIPHPESVAIMLANTGMDSHTILAGLMHDVI